MSSKVMYNEHRPRLSTSPRMLQEDTAGVLLRVVTEKTACEIVTGEPCRGEAFTAVAVIIPASEYGAYQAFVAAREAFKAIL